MSTTKVSAALMESGTKGADISSASSITIGLDGSYMDITGTTTIATMVCDAGRIFTLQFDSAVTLTHSSTLYLAGAVDFVTEANDHLTFVAVAANDVRQIGAGLKDGGSPVAAAGVSGLTNNSNTTWMTVSADEEVNMPLQPCFHAYLSAGVNDITGDGTNYTVVWDAERFYQGGDFASNTFTAPISGRYLLSFHFSTSTGIDTSVDTVATYIVTSDVTFTTLMSDTNDMGYVRHSSIAVVCNMDAADTATTAVQIVGGAATVDLEATGYTHFSGCLIA